MPADLVRSSKTAKDRPSELLNATSNNNTINRISGVSDFSKQHKFQTQRQEKELPVNDFNGDETVSRIMKKRDSITR